MGNQGITTLSLWQMIETELFKIMQVLTPQAINPRLVRLGVQANNFVLKLVMFQMLQIVGKLNGLLCEDDHLHLKLFLEVSDAFKIVGASQEALRLRLFLFSLKDRAKTWLNTLPLTPSLHGMT